MRLLASLVSLCIAGYGIWFIGSTRPEVKTKIEEFLHTGTFHTLEIRYTANQIMESQRKDLLKDNRHKYLDASLKFYPYLLLEVKYLVSDDKTKEGVMLWDMTDGEMVIDTRQWEKTHGFADCINANTSAQEFKVINLLARKGGVSDREGLTKSLHVDHEVLDAWIDSCRRKKLIVQAGNKYRLHLENPRLKTLPSTKLEERLVTKSHSNTERIRRRYSLSQIEKITRAAFGTDFSIRKTTDVYLPVHCIVVQNPDGSIHTSHWNALNGKRLEAQFVN
ncbi:MAG: hypothetical protein K2P51_08730 [Rhabdochlamydiaceae bacterium]|nr:hypothetical protein [Rhabdochlamydiaceae bacterium]